jgi:ubiquinone/menaquinone biosynthesis C-methylase UbiE
MANTAPFEEHTERYERWFDEYEAVYESELTALERLVSATGRGIEIGVGSGRFAAPLDIDVGIDPADAMLRQARERGVAVARGVAEQVPFGDDTFDTALIVTTICFVDDIPGTLTEADRVLSESGELVIGYIDKESPVGEIYQANKESNPFYREATFVSTDDLLDALEAAGFSDFEFVQTVYNWIDEVESPEPVEAGRGEGSFVGIRATR